jgi:APA family basic amino acid/polyamine antiporter
LQDAIFLVVASVVGSGIFKTPGAIASELPHVALIFGVWIIGGLLSLAGALANAELGAMFPHAGGDYVYLKRAFHSLAGFVVGWITFFAIFAGTVATLAVAFAEDFGALFGWSRGLVIVCAVAVTVACTLLNVISVKWSAWANNSTGWLKVVALCAFAFVAPFLAGGDAANFSPLAKGALAAAHPSGLALAISPVLFSYLGWNATVYVASEIRDPQRNVPRSLFIGLALCTGIYLLMNGVYIYTLGLAGLGASENAGVATAQVLFGSLGGKLLTGFVLMSFLGTLNATVLVGARVAYAMALDGAFIPGVERVHEEYATPSVALWLQAAVASALVIVLKKFPDVLNFTTFAIVIATSADVLALFALRIRQPGLARPYRAWGYPVVPALYIIANVVIAAGMLIGSPIVAGTSLAVCLVGVPFFYYFDKRRASR